MTYCHSALDW